jgi:hypothetical protein
MKSANQLREETLEIQKLLRMQKIIDEHKEMENAVSATIKNNISAALEKAKDKGEFIITYKVPTVAVMDPVRKWLDSLGYDVSVIGLLPNKTIQIRWNL